MEEGNKVAGAPTYSVETRMVGLVTSGNNSMDKRERDNPPKMRIAITMITVAIGL